MKSNHRKLPQNGNFLSHIRETYREAYDKANVDHQDDAFPSRLINAYNYAVHYPAIVREAQQTHPLMMRTHAGRVLAIHDTLSFMNKKSAQTIADFAEHEMHDEMNSAWVRLDPAQAVNDYLDTQKHLDYKGKPNDFDRILKMESLSDYKDHVLFIAKIVEEHRYNQDIRYFDFNDVQDEKRSTTIKRINTAAEDLKNDNTLKLVPD